MMPPYTKYQIAGWISGPLLFLCILLLPANVLSNEMGPVIGVALWMVIWWITEAVSISVTALLPLLLFPLLGIMDIKSVSSQYGNPIIFLFFGGFIIALGLEKVQLHKRIALRIIQLTGTSPNRIVLGFMIATALLSMWISNTATTLVMLPIAVSVIDLLRNDTDGFTKNDRYFSLSILLGIAYSANIGGVATIIGTPPNMVLVGFLESNFELEISFLHWMMIGLPFSTIMLSLLYVVLVKWMYPNHLPEIASGKSIINAELKKLGPIRKEEKFVMVIFSLAMVLWTTRGMINTWLPGLPLTDTGISMLAAVLLFSVPHNIREGKFLLDWKDTKNIPWGILILFGGGLALASGMAEAGIIDQIGQAISSKENMSGLLVVSLLVLVVLFMTELMSNVALVTIFIPVVAGIATGFGIPLLEILVPITIASSCAFMLPMATPPNAIVFASGHVTVKQMVRAGFILNILSVVVIVILARVFIPGILE